MKRSLIMLLALILLLTGCSLRFTLPEETEAYVPIPTATFAPTEATEEPTEPVPTAPDGRLRMLDEEGRIVAYSIPPHAFTLGDASDGDSFQTCGYDGGEMRLPFQYTGGRDTDLAGLGMVVFLDGQPQPYKLAENGKYEYMHVFTEMEGEGTLYFIPVCGKAGDKLELCAVLISAADWFPWERREGGQVKLRDNMDPYQNYLATGVVLQFNADPAPVPNFPAVRDRVEELTVSEEDWTLTNESDVFDLNMIAFATGNLAEWEERTMASNVFVGSVIHWGYDQEGVELRFKPTYNGGQYAYKVKETSKVNFICGIYCEKPVDYSLVLFFNDEPISVDPEDVVLFSGGTSGTKMVVSFTLDMTEMKEANKIMVMAVARNYQTLCQQRELEDTSYDELGFKIFPMYTILTSCGNYSDYAKAVSN